MSNSITLKHAEQLNIQNNAEQNSNSNSSLIEREPVEGTPFWIVGNSEKGYIGVLGKYQITENQTNKQEVLNYIDENMWKVVMIIAGSIATDLINENNKK